MKKIFRRARLVAQQDKLSSVESGGLFLINLTALGFFFFVASASAPFFFLYLAYVLNTGAHVYDRGIKGTLGDVQAFLKRAMPL